MNSEAKTVLQSPESDGQSRPSQDVDQRARLGLNGPSSSTCGSPPSRVLRDGNSSTGTRYLSGTRLDGYGYGDDFLPVGGICTRPESRRVRDGYFFPPVGNPTGTRYFTTAIILGCEQVKMCSFCYINYDLF
jgi:hypothetical protein